MSTIEIRVDGSDVTSQVIFSDAQFTQQANGQPGTCKFRLRDLPHTDSPRAGNTVTLDIDGQRVWGGWALRVSPGYFFAADDTRNPTITERQWTLEGVDYNILFSKRFLVNKADPTKMLPNYPKGTPDDEIVLDLVNNFLYLGGDGISTAGVTHVGTPNEDSAFNAGNPGASWGSAMTLTAGPTQAVFYIDAGKVLRFVDVETVTAPFALTDTPFSGGGGGTGGHDITETFNRTVAAGVSWGTGELGTWSPVQLTDSVSVTPGAAHMQAGGQRWQRFSTAVFDGDSLTTTARFLWPTGAFNPVYIGLDIGQDVFGFTNDVEVIIDDGGNLEIFDDHGGDDTEFAGFPNEGTWSTIALQLDPTTGTARAKFWQDPDPDPGWQASISTPITMAQIAQAAVLGGNIDGTDIIFESVNAVDGPFVPPIASGVGYRDMEVTFDGTKLVNDFLEWGAAPHATTDIAFVRIQDSASIAEHGRWQMGEFNTGLYTSQGVNDRARSFVYGSPQSKRGGKDDSRQIVCTLFEPGLAAGQIVSFTSSIFDYTEALPIRRLGINFPNPTSARFMAFLSWDVDAPWSDFEFWFPKLNFNIPHIDVNIDIPDGVPVLPPTTGCDDAICGITDGLQRVIGAGFGTSDYGPDWQDTYNDSGFGAVASSDVVGTYARMKVTHNTSLNQSYGEVDEDLFLLVPDAFDITFDVNENQWDTTIPSSFGPVWGAYVVTQSGYEAHFNVIGGIPSSLSMQMNGQTAVQQSLFELTPGAWYSVRFQWDGIVGSDLRVKFWPMDDTEPLAWTLTKTILTEPPRFAASSEFQFFVLGDQSTGSTLGQDIELFFKQLSIAGLDRCASVQFDNFNRTVSGSAGVDLAGTATPSGLVWKATAFPGGSDFGVNGSELYVGTSGGTINIRTPISGGPWQTVDEIEFDIRFTFFQQTGVFANFPSFQTQLVDGAGNNIGWNFQVGGVTGGFVLFSSPSGGSILYHLPSSWTTLDYQTNTYWFHVKWHVIFSTGFVEAKVWRELDGEPSGWQVQTTTGFQQPMVNATARFNLQIGSSFANRAEYVDYLQWNYDGMPCYPGGPVVDPAQPLLHGYPCESFTGGLAQITLSQAYIPTTTRVYMDGLFLRQGIDYSEHDPLNGIIWLSVAPAEGSIVTVCFGATIG